MLRLTAPACLALLPLLSIPVQDHGGVGYDDTPQLPDSEWRVHDKARPVPEVVDPGPLQPCPPPPDAVVLFDGSGLGAWKGREGDACWTLAGEFMEVDGSGDIETREHFGDLQLHLEWASPEEVQGESQGRGNSGVFLMGRYEIQILDSYENRSYADGQAAALYGQRPPDVNACRAPGEWQSFDVLFRAPRFAGEELVSPGVVTVLHNGLVVHHAVPFLGATAHRALASYAAHAAEGPIKLQDHGNPVRFRNVWVRRL